MATENDDQLVERLVPKILSSIRAKAKAVESVPIKEDLTGITSMPCYNTTGGQYKMVLVPIEVLKQAASEEALLVLEECGTATNAANSAASSANTAATKANTAATTADTATSKANTATSNANSATESATAAATTANNAAKTADAATEAAQEATSKANTATSNANSATEAANDAAEKCEEIIEEAQNTGSLNLVPTAMELTYPKWITYGNMAELFVKAVLSPASVVQNVLFLGDNKAVTVTPDGRLTVVGAGTTTIHVIPTANTALYRSIQIKVGNPTLRFVNTRSQLFLLENGNLLFN